MHPKRRALLWINLLGGVAVIGSYAQGFLAHPELAPGLWGDVPETVRPLYTVSMLLAAAGYFAFTLPVAFRLDPDRIRVAGAGYEIFAGLYLLILVPSALWMPLTFQMLAQPGVALWWSIRLVLFLVGGGSVGLILALALAKPWPSTGLRRLALVGAVAFAFQTAVLDAALWPAWFPTPR
jgi:hypothetical protein